VIGPTAIVHGAPSDPAWRLARTVRGLERLGFARVRLATDAGALRTALVASAGPAWLLRSGTWPLGAAWRALPPSATGRPLLALGAVHGDSAAARGWDAPRDLEREGLPPVASAYLEAPLCGFLAQTLDGQGLDEALAALCAKRGPRVVRVAALDVAEDERLRVAEIVTSFQQGGAERLAMELAAALAEQPGITSRLVALGGPTRASFEPPLGAKLLEWEREKNVALRAPRLAIALVADGIDVIHGHLLEADDARALAASRVPLVLTIHNERPSWPLGLESLSREDAVLLVGCARAVERDLRAAGLRLPIRTVWNGIDVERLAATDASASAWREKLGIGAADFVLLAVANPRPQKRLERLPAILARLDEALAQAGIRRTARLVVAGAPSRASAASILAQSALEAEIERLGLGPRVHLLGSVTEMAPLYRAASVFVSTSGHEGLSLAQLEALAANLPVVATDVGGIAEVAARVPGVRLLSREASAAEFAVALAAVAAEARPDAAPGIRAHFSVGRTAVHQARLLRSAVGAQTSARRLLGALRDRGVRTRAVVIQEQPEFPTPGRRALIDAGVPVAALPPPEEEPAERAVERLVALVDADPPEAVVFWNAMPEHKLLLADALFDLPLFDVSPGEMYFESLERVFRAPRAGFSYERPADYGARLSGVIVKFAAEAEKAAALGAPVHVIPNGVPVLGERRPGSANGTFTIGTLARLDPRKRLDRLLDALRLAAPRLPPYRLRIGGGAERGYEGHLDELRDKARGLNVEFLGDVPDSSGFLGDIDLFAMVAEPAGCPNASLEAMGHGLAVVATDAGGIAEQVVDGETGRLVGREDVAALAEALVDVASDTGRRQAMGEAGRARVRERFGLDRMAERYREVLLGAPAQSRG